jgi:hypothetical protein
MNQHERRKAKSMMKSTYSIPIGQQYVMHDVVLYPENESGGVTVFANAKGRDAVRKVLPSLEEDKWTPHGYGLRSKDGVNWRMVKVSDGDRYWRSVPKDFKEISHMDVAAVARNFGHNLDPINRELPKLYPNKYPSSDWDDVLTNSAPQAIAFLLLRSIQRQTPGARLVSIDNNDATNVEAMTFVSQAN